MISPFLYNTVMKYGHDCHVGESTIKLEEYDQTTDPCYFATNRVN